MPEWAKRAVWYQIFPERFRNGDTTNDPTVNDIIGSWPHETPKEWNRSPWTSDWYKLQPWEAADDKGFYYHVQRRRYGGDVQGVLEKLDYLSELGITAIYFNPLFESPSLHKYDATMYHHIDNNFGPDPDGDKKTWASENPADPSTWKWTSADKLFLTLVEECHRRGIKVIIDGVFNHVGMTFWAFEDVKKNGEKSFYKNWFTIKKWDDPITQENEFEYEGWFGVKELPELREDENGLVSGPKEHIHAIVKRWMDPNGDGNPADGIDGWRLDVADMVSLNFWKEFRTWVRAINPDAYLTGEVWWENWKENKMYNAARWLQGDAFDAVMNYRWAAEVCHFFIDKNDKTVVSEFDRRIKSLQNDYPEHVNYVLMNLMDSHDTDRLPSRIVNPDMQYDHRVGLNDNRNYNVRKPTAEEYNVQKLIALFQMTYVGAPMIYYGDEVGMWGGDDPDERKPMLWADLTYDDEASHPFGEPRPRDKNAADMELFDYYKKLIKIRKENEALMVGSFHTLLTDDKSDVYAFLRAKDENVVVVVLNNADSESRATISNKQLLKYSEWQNLLTGELLSMSHGMIDISLRPKSGVVLRAKQ